jgi:hypothetical protein
MRPGPFDLYGYKGRHRKPSDTANAARNIAVTAGVVAAVMSGDVSPAQAAPGMPGEDAWNRLRVCESGNNYAINTGNGYYGAYQFDLSTWRGAGGKGYPNQATPLEQDYRARLLYRARGWSPWACARILGLSANPVYGMWTSPVTIRATQKFVVGSPVTVSGTTGANSWVRVYAKNYGSSAYREAANVKATAQGRWTASFRPYGGASYYAVSGGQRTSTVTAQGLFAPTLVAPGTTALNTGYKLVGKARPSGTVQVYIKAHYQQNWLARRTVKADTHGNWTTVWRGTTDFTFAVRGDVAGPTRTVRVVTTADQMPQPLVTGDPVSLGGTARPNTGLTVFVRKQGTTAWGRLADTRSDSHGNWSATLKTAGSYEYYAQSANGQASAQQRISVP